MFRVKRSNHNPILSPNPESDFESLATFNGNPIEVNKTTYLLYRAQNKGEKFEGRNFSLSVIGLAKSNDGLNFSDRTKFIYPTEVWERYGLEDPRVTKINGRYFIFYTALSIFPFTGDGIRVGLAISDDMKTIAEKHPVTPFNAKAMVLFPEKINGKFVAMLSVNTDRPPSRIAMVEFSKLEEIWDESFWKKWFKNLDKHIVEIPKMDGDQLEIGSVPIKTKDGWLLVYSHISDYFSNNKTFGIRAILLDLKNPQGVIGQTRGNLLVPVENYENNGQISNVIFPSGALIKNGKLIIYYGAADAHCAVASVDFESVLETMKLPWEESGFSRVTSHSLLVPRRDLAWEKKAIFNPAAIDVNRKVSILYRAMSEDNTSVIGYAESRDAMNISHRDNEPIYKPRESFEEKRVPGGNSGCEDPRLTKIGDYIYMYYVAYNGVTPPSGAMSKIKESDFKKENWNKWSKPVLVTADGVDDKDVGLHPEKINGKYMLYHRVNNKICVDFSDTPEFKERNNFKNVEILGPRPGMWDSVKVGITAPPIKTKKGWLLLYHGVSGRSRYRVGAALLDLKDPTKVISRLTDCILEPREAYEISGQVNYVVFPCGAILRKGTIYIYFGGGDSVISVAQLSLEKLLQALN